MSCNLEYYKVFYYTAKCGSLTEAARELSVSQPAVSQSLKQLEQQSGSKLFYRSGKGVRLTAEGELLYSYVAGGLEQILLGEHRLAQMRHLELGEIRIGASDMTLRFYLLPYLERFHEKYPDIRVMVSNAPTPETLELLREGRIDFGVVSTPFAASDEIRAVPVKEIEDIFVAGRRFMQYKNKMLELSVLEQLPLITLEGGTSTRSSLDEFLKQNQVTLCPEFELATSDMIVQFALRSLGIGSVVRDFAEEAIESGQLFELRFRRLIPKRSFCVVSDGAKPVSPAAAAMLEMLLEEVKVP